MIFKQLKAAGLAAAAVALAASAWGQAAGDYAGGSPFQVVSAKNNHQYALEQIAGTKTITGYPLYVVTPGPMTIPGVMGFTAGDQQRPLVKLIIDPDEAREGVGRDGRDPERSARCCTAGPLAASSRSS